MSFNNLILVDKQYGATPLETIQALRRLGVIGEKEKATYAGRLDPLATGLLLILKGEGTKEKEKYLGLEKVYKIELTFGVATDSGDILGMPRVDSIAPVPTLKAIQETLESITEIEYPNFSSKTVKGKPLHEYAREGIEIPRPSRPASYHVLAANASAPLTAEEIKARVQHACELVTGDFRQGAILAAWQQAPISKALETYELTLRVSSGTYMRAIPEILANKLGANCVVTKIHRVKVGEYDLLNCSKNKHHPRTTGHHTRVMSAVPRVAR